MTVNIGSRYEQAERGWTASHVYDVFRNARFEETVPPTLRFVVVNREALYRVNSLPLPPPPPAEYYAKDTEVFPFLGFKFLGDATTWWRIAEVNPGVWYPLDLTMGTYLRIPS